MKPDREGIWEWVDSNAVKHLVVVVDVGSAEKPHLRVYWWGGYYDVHDNPNEPSGSPFRYAQWPDSWGNFIGEANSIPNNQLYLGPTPEAIAKMRAEHPEYNWQ